jgi:hypothetical protein
LLNILPFFSLPPIVKGNTEIDYIYWHKIQQKSDRRDNECQIMKDLAYDAKPMEERPTAH